MEIIKFNKDELSQTLQPILSVVERRNAPILLNVLITFRETGFHSQLRYRDPNDFDSYKRRLCT